MSKIFEVWTDSLQKIWVAEKHIKKMPNITGHEGSSN